MTGRQKSNLKMKHDLEMSLLNFSPSTNVEGKFNQSSKQVCTMRLNSCSISITAIEDTKHEGKDPTL